MTKQIFIGPDKKLVPTTVMTVVNNPEIKVLLSPKAIAAVKKSRAIIERISHEKRVIYGVTTGFGKFKDKFISESDLNDLQTNLIRSHAIGVGPLMPASFVRALLLIRINSLARGYSGVRLELLETALAFLNNDIMPCIPIHGSVGASGDLAPLSHAGLALMGEGYVIYRGKKMTTKEALKKARLKPTYFTAKEGLAWTNGTAFLSSYSSITLEKARGLIVVADAALALSAEGLCGVSNAFDKRIHAIRPHPGQAKTAENVRKLTQGSKLIDAHIERIQDSYSLRCAPQVHGATRDAINNVTEIVERELNSVTDNPVIVDQKPFAISGGNFHGQPMSLAMDYLKTALSGLGNISERRIAKMVDPATSEGLPAFLISTEKGGLHNGLMIAQYTAAALVSENKINSHPASVDSIPTSANQEDHVSMGSISSRKAYDVSENVTYILAIELLTAAQAIEFRDHRKMGRGTYAIYQAIRRLSPALKNDRSLSEDLEKIAIAIRDGSLVELINKYI